MRVLLEKLNKGEITFDAFVRRTRADWESIARHLMRRWRCPEGVETADVVQELIAAVWARAPKFDPNRGKSFADFVIWNACTDAKKWIHSQRDAHRRDDKSKSRHPISFSNLKSSSDHADQSNFGGLVDKAKRWPGQVEETDFFAAVEIWESVEIFVEEDQFRAPAAKALIVSGFDATAAAELVYADLGVRRSRRLCSREEARAFVDDTLRAIAVVAA